MGDERPGRCWYCCEPRLRIDDPPEHVIPSALGGTLTTDRVCRECNERAGREIDLPLQNDWLVAQTKILHEVVSSRRGSTGKPKTGRSDAHRKGDPGTVVDISRDWTPTVRSKIERTGTTAKIAAGSEDEANRLRERLVKQLNAEGLQIDTEETTREQFNEVAINVTLDGVVWLRAAAKMMLGALSLCVDDTLLETADIARLRRWLWEKQPTYDDGSPAFADPNQPILPETLVAPPPTHVVSVYSAQLTEKRVVVSIGLFGTFYVRAGVGLSPPLPDKVWLVVPGESARELTWDSFIDEATRRTIEQNKQATSSAAE